MLPLYILVLSVLVLELLVWYLCAYIFSICFWLSWTVIVYVCCRGLCVRTPFPCPHMYSVEDCMRSLKLDGFNETQIDFVMSNHCLENTEQLLHFVAIVWSTTFLTFLHYFVLPNFCLYHNTIHLKRLDKLKLHLQKFLKKEMIFVKNCQNLKLFELD